MRALLLLILLIGCGTTVGVERDPSLFASLRTFPLDDLAEVQSNFVDGNGRVDYGALQANREPLDDYIGLIGLVGPSTRPELFPTKQHELAYWINAYNAIVLHQVLLRPPPSSVGDRKVTFFYSTKYRVDGRRMSLWTMENDVIRAFGDARIHFAINCASIGCPQLPQEPFYPERLEQQLERETKKFLGDESKVRVAGKTLHLSKIFDWFEEDFEPGPAAWIRAYRPEVPEDAEVKWIEYDWGLNEQGR
ncbi:MAG: DUF547 domain-containing protein [Planctomycetota bacterium]